VASQKRTGENDMMRKKLTKKEKLAIKKWLDSNSHDRMSLCTFNIRDWNSSCGICFSWFPKIEKTNSCPCREYSLKTIIKRAKEMMEK
jgi:hypothetical protein